MAYEFAVRQTQAWFQALFAEPAFELLRDPGALYARLYGRLAGYGLRLGDLSVQVGTPQLGEFYLECRLPRTTIRVFLDRVEASSTHGADAAIGDAVSTLVDYLPSIAVKTYSYTLGVNGVVEGVRPEEFVARFSAETPQSLGPHRGSGVIFYYGPASERLASSVTFDLSQVIENGVLVQVYVVYDAQLIELAKVTEKAREYLEEALREIGLACGGGD